MATPVENYDSLVGFMSFDFQFEVAFDEIDDSFMFVGFISWVTLAETNDLLMCCMTFHSLMPYVNFSWELYWKNAPFFLLVEVTWNDGFSFFVNTRYNCTTSGEFYILPNILFHILGNHFPLAS